MDELGEIETGLSGGRAEELERLVHCQPLRRGCHPKDRSVARVWPALRRFDQTRRAGVTENRHDRPNELSNRRELNAPGTVLPQVSLASVTLVDSARMVAVD